MVVVVAVTDLLLLELAVELVPAMEELEMLLVDQHLLQTEVQVVEELVISVILLVVMVQRVCSFSEFLQLKRMRLLQYNMDLSPSMPVAISQSPHPTT